MLYCSFTQLVDTLLPRMQNTWVSFRITNSNHVLFASSSMTDQSPVLEIDEVTEKLSEKRIEKLSEKQSLRVSHASTERKRRLENNAAFNTLKQMVPESRNRLSMCKTDILHCAIRYISEVAKLQASAQQQRPVASPYSRPISSLSASYYSPSPQQFNPDSHLEFNEYSPKPSHIISTGNNIDCRHTAKQDLMPMLNLPPPYISPRNSPFTFIEHRPRATPNQPTETSQHRIIVADTSDTNQSFDLCNEAGPEAAPAKKRRLESYATPSRQTHTSAHLERNLAAEALIRKSMDLKTLLN